jgi:alanyl-tRNA synthetase
VESLSRPQVERVEDLANDVIFGDRRVTSSTLTPDQTASLGAEGRDGRPLRKTQKPGSALRIVDIEGFDRCACGGTHVKRAGEIGMIKIVRLEHRGRGLRVEFRCGRRALTDYRVKHDLISKLAADLTVGYWDVGRAVDSLRHEFKSFRRQVREAGERLLEHEARDLLRGAQRYEKLCVVSAVFSERDRRQLGRLAKKLIEQPGVVVLFGLADVKSHLLFARAEDLELDMRPALASALSALGAQGGGGRPAMAQGGGPAADEEQIRAAIGHALQLLTNDG